MAAVYTGETYEESYRKFDNLKKLEEEVSNDIIIAYMCNWDRVPRIIEAARKVIKEKFNEEIEQLPLWKKINKED